MRRYHGDELPTFTLEERALLKDSIDFVGINHYSTLYAKDCIHSSCLCNESFCINGSDRPIQGFVYVSGERNGIPIGEKTGVVLSYVVPKGMEDIVSYIKERYHNKPMFITENGYATLVDEYNDDLHDLKRVHFHQSYLTSLAKVIRDGADVRGYFIWSLMDNFEWFSGYETKYGIYHIDPTTLNRVPKLSAHWYRDFLTNSSLIDVVTGSSIVNEE